MEFSASVGFIQKEYRKLVKYFKQKNIFCRTYRLKDERAYRIVITCPHHTTVTEDIRQELSELGHNVGNIINTQHRTTKEPVNLFFEDLETVENKKEMYSTRALQNKIQQMEPLQGKKGKCHNMYEMPAIWPHKIIP